MKIGDKEVLTTTEVAEISPITESQLRNWVQYNKCHEDHRGPEYIRVGGKILYFTEVIEGYIADLMRGKRE